MLAVPLYQRPYAWDDEQVDELFEDLGAAVAKDRENAEYFLGSIVLAYQDRERAEVVDGQQRLVTITILLAAIRDYFLENEDTETAGLVEQEFLIKRHIRTLQVIPRLRLNDRDNDFFERHVLQGRRFPLARSTPESHKRIATAADRAYTYTRRIVEGQSDPRDVLITWVHFLQRRAQVIVVEVPDHSDAFTIFETLNDRGAEMDVTDLLKNHLLRLASPDRLQDVDRSWNQVLKTLEPLGRRTATDFVRHYWSSKRGLTRERLLYNKIRDNVTSKTASASFAAELRKAAPTYAALLDAESEYWDEVGSPARQYVDALNSIGVVAMRPLLLAVLQEFSRVDVIRSLRLFVSWATRLFVVGSLGSGALEEFYSTVAVDVRSGKISSSKDFLDYAIAPTDAEFAQAFTAHAPRKLKLAKYYMSVLEAAAQKQPKATAGLVLPDDNFTLSYIRDPNEEDPAGDTSEEGENILRLSGNTCLIESELKHEMSGLDFLKRRKLYSRSVFTLTQELAEFRRWNLESIKERQNRLASLAPQAWTVDVKDP